MPVLGDDVDVPVADLVGHAQAEAVGGLREADAVLAGQLRQVVEAAQGVGQSQGRRHLPDVVVVEDGRLPEAAVALGVGGELVGQAS